MNYWDNGPLTISANGKYLKNGTVPFFWLGDTAWLLMQQLTLAEAETYLLNRKKKGFNVIQATLIHSLPGENASSLAKNKVDVTTPAYWEHCDRVVQLSEKLGLYLGLLPTWGSIVKSQLLNLTNVEAYANFLAQRYSSYPNIIWILGGDIRGSDGFEVHQKLGQLLKEKMPDKLIAYHPFGRTASSQWFQQEAWLDINMFQSGHRRYDQGQLGQWDDKAGQEVFFGEDNWQYVLKDHQLPPLKPTLDGEPSYEQIPQGLHDPQEPYWQAYDIRRYAYWSVFTGACGHTYGHNAVQQCYTGETTEQASNYGVRQTWQEAIHHVGSSQLQYLKDLMLSVDFQKGGPRDDLLLTGQKEKYQRIAVFAGPDFLFAYSYLGETFTLDLTSYQDQVLYALWLDPISGSCSYFQKFNGNPEYTFTPPTKYEGQNDWVLVLRSNL